MSDCIFCKIIKGEIPNYTVYEDDFVLAFLDIHPHAKGHTVVVPKEHKTHFADLSEEEAKKFIIGVKKAIERINSVLKPEGVNVGWNDGESAGQVIPHLHVHIFPRWKGDGGGSVHSIIKNQGDVEVEQAAKLFL